MKELIDTKFLMRFLNKELSEEENNQVFRWVAYSEENREEFREIHQAYHMTKLKQYGYDIDIDKAWEDLYNQLPHEKRKKSRHLLNNVWKIAASVAIIVALGFGSLWMNEQFFQGSEMTKVRFESPSGEKSKIVLADGTRVWLNSESSLIYDVSEPREAILDGEAFFDVVKDREYPFEVKTSSGMGVKVLGTKFNLKSYSGDPNVEATLEEGEIVIIGIKTNRPVVLSPGEQANYNVKNKEVQVSKVSAEIYSLWRNNELRLKDISFEDLVPRIERWYGVNISLDTKISQSDRFNLTIKTESIRELLNMMQLTSKFDYEINGENIIIRAK